jgi:hypothetical protein
MPVCPNCGKVIDSLINYSNVVEKHKFYLIGDNVIYELLDRIPAVASEDTYACPHCDATLFYNEQDAKEFLSS